jgi:chromosome segregation ATPase
VEQDDIPSTGDDQVLGMLSAIEQQLRHLGDTQRQHEDQLTSLIERSASSAQTHQDAGDSDPQSKQPSFVVDMDDDGNDRRSSEDQKGLQAMATEVEASREQTDQMKQQLEAAQVRIKELADLPGDADELKEKTEELADANDKIDALQSRVIELEAVAAVSDDDDDSEEKDEQITALEQQVAHLHRKLREQAESDDKPAAPPVDSTGAEMIERQRKQIERLTEQLAEVNAGGDPGDIQERDARIAELEEQLEELQGEGGGKQAVSKLVAGFGGALRQVRGKQGSGDEDEVSELEERVAELEIERKQLREEAEQARKESDKARELIEHAATGEGSGDAEEEVVALRAQVAQLERRPGGDHGELRSKIETEYRQKWNEVAQREESLTAAEEKMRQKWARPRAVVVFGHLAGLAVMVAIVSWLLAGRIFAPTIAASVAVEAKSPSGVPVSDEDKAEWQEVHGAMLFDAPFHKTVAKRLVEQRLDDYGDPDTLAERLEDDLTVDSPKAGAITLTLAGKDRDETAAVLDTVATTLALVSAQQAGKRSDGAIAVVRGERRESGHVRYATINGTAIKDRRAIGSVVIFIVGFFISAFAISRLYRGLLSTRSAMGDDDMEITADLF